VLAYSLLAPSVVKEADRSKTDISGEMSVSSLDVRDQFIQASNRNVRLLL